MFDKKIIIFFVFLLFILHISLVSATECNETDIIAEINDNQELSVNNNVEQDVCELEDCDDEDCDEFILDFNQGDKIPITINSPVEGNLTVLIDNEIYGVWNFSKNKTILIPTYNQASFYNPSIKNIGVGDHKLSLIFNLNTFNNYVPMVSEDDSNLKFRFNICDGDILNAKYTYSLNSELTIFEKRNTIYLMLAPPFDRSYPASYSAGVLFNVVLNNISWKSWKDKHTGHSFGVVISHNTEILLKKDADIAEAYDFRQYFDEYGVRGLSGDFFYDVDMDYNVLCKLGICNLTVVNFADGTTDTILFNISKFYMYFEKIDCIVNKSDVTFCFYQYFPKVFVGVDDGGKFISPKDYQWNTTFVNLNSGGHVMNFYYLQNDFSKQHLYRLPFEINRFSSITVNIVPKNVSCVNNTCFNLSCKCMVSRIDGSLNSGYGIKNLEGRIIMSNSNLHGNKFKLHDEDMSVGGDDTVSSFSKSSSNAKSYEISNKLASKSIDNLLAKLGLTIFSCMSFMVGYFKFEKNQ